MIKKQYLIIILLVIGVIFGYLFFTDAEQTCPVTGETGYDTPQGWGEFFHWLKGTMMVAFIGTAVAIWFIKR